MVNVDIPVCNIVLNVPEITFYIIFIYSFTLSLKQGFKVFTVIRIQSGSFRVDRTFRSKIKDIWATPYPPTHPPTHKQTKEICQLTNCHSNVLVTEFDKVKVDKDLQNPH